MRRNQYTSLKMPPPEQLLLQPSQQEKSRGTSPNSDSRAEPSFGWATKKKRKNLQLSSECTCSCAGRDPLHQRAQAAPPPFSRAKPAAAAPPRGDSSSGFLGLFFFLGGGNIHVFTKRRCSKGLFKGCSVKGGGEGPPRWAPHLSYVCHNYWVGQLPPPLPPVSLRSKTPPCLLTSAGNVSACWCTLAKCPLMKWFC